MSNPNEPDLTIQTASLWSMGDSDVFSGTGGPFGYDPFFGQFGGVISSDGLDAEPFQDQLWNVSAGDEVVFVVAVQNRGGQDAYDILLRTTMPAGFMAPDGDPGVSVTDGAGNALNVSGSPFDPNGGLLIQDPLGAYDPASGANVALVTFTLQATSQLAIPFAALNSTATILSYADVSGGPTLTGNDAPGSLQASTGVGTAGISVSAAADQSLVSLNPFQQASFDITINVPPGEVSHLNVQELLPHQGNAWFQLVSAQIVSSGAGLSSPDPIILQPDGTLALGSLTSAASSTDPHADTLVLRVTVRNGGTAAGQGLLKTIVTADDPNTQGGHWTDEVDSQLALTAPDIAPTISGTVPNQNATDTMLVHPFAGVTVTDPDVGQTETATIQLSDKLLGSLAGTQGTWDPVAGSYTIRGTVDVVQAAMRGLAFTSGAGRSGLEQFSITVDDGLGGVAHDSAATLNVSAASPDAAGIQHFALSPTATVLTSTASGESTVAQIETYQGPVDYLQTQFIYDGTQPLAIVAQTPNTFIKSVAGAAAVKLLSGQNVVDAGHGSNFLIGGTGQDVFYLDGRQPIETWDTIVGFNPGDIATLWGYTDGVSHYWWDDNAGAPGYTGRTLRADLTGSGHIEASITFAGKTATDTGHYAVTTGTIGGNDYMTIFAR